jgi:hypothetical protein
LLLVVEPIYGRDKVVNLLMKGRGWTREEKEVKARGGLGKGEVFFLGEVIFLIYGKVRNLERGRRREEENWVVSVMHHYYILKNLR